MPRKRFNAFDDFPAGSDAEPEHDTGWTQERAQPEERGRAGIAEGEPPALFGARKVLAHPEAPQVERIERLKPSQMIPDRFQPRRLLPTVLREPFYTGKIDCYQAAREWLQMARSDASLRDELDRLMAMGLSFEEHGQIKPITGSWAEAQDGSYVFQIETGERRYWAACLQAVAHKLEEEPLLRVESVERPTRMRQVLENRHAEPPSAVGQACEIAALILAELNQTPSTDDSSEFDYFRQAIDRRMPNGVWERMIPVMQLTQRRMRQLLDILQLPNALLDLADRHRVPERVLREVMQAPQPQWEALLRSSIQKGWTSDDVAEVTRPKSIKTEKRTAEPPDPILQAMNALRRFANAIQTLDEETHAAVLDELANDIVLADQGETMLDTLRALSERIRIRQHNRQRRR